MGASWADWKSEKSLKCHFLLFYTTIKKHFLIGLWHVMKSGFYVTRRWPAQWLDWEDGIKHSPKPNLHQKRLRSLFGVLLLFWSSTAFWILANSLHLRNILSKVKKCTEKLQCLQPVLVNWKGQFFSMTTPNHTSHNQHFKSWTTWVVKFCLICHICLTSHQLTYHFFKHLDFLQGKCFHGQQDAESAFQEFVGSQNMEFYTTGKKQTCFSLAKVC